MARKKAEPVTAPKDKQKPRVKATGLAVQLPGADSVDATLLDRAVQELNQLYRTKGLETARAVAEVVIDVFFGGSVENFESRSGSHISFIELKKRADLQVSYQFVWNSCAVYDQLRQLPQDVTDVLPMSHQKLLLPVKDPELKLALAQAAVDEKLGKREFEQRIKEIRKASASSRAGRPALPAFAKALTQVRRAVNGAVKCAVDEESFANYTKEEALAELAAWDRQVAELSQVCERIRALVGG